MNYDWLRNGKQELMDALHIQDHIIHGRAKNVILFIGDGLGISTTAATRMWQYQQRSTGTIQDAQMSYEKLPHVGLAMVH